MEAPVELSGRNLEALLDDLDSSVRELLELLEQDPVLWGRGRPGKWTAGQHVDHVGRMLGVGADRLEQSAKRLEDGTLGRRPWRDPLQAWFVRLATGSRFPKGGKAIKEGTPAASPERMKSLARLRSNVERFRALARRLTPEQRDRLWFWNPFIPLPWHYTFPEMIRVQANHTRHHANGVREALWLPASRAG